MVVDIMIRGLIVVPQQKSTNYEINIPLSNNRNEKHDKYLLEYLAEQNIPLEGMEDAGVYKLYTYCASLGFLLFQIDTDITIAYLPKELTTYQYEWYKKNKKRLHKYNLAIVDITEDGIDHYDQLNLDTPAFSKFRELIEDKKIVSTERGKINVKNKS